MPLPIHTLPTIERWDCHQCGNCCRGSIDPLNESDLARLREQQWRKRPEFVDVSPTVPLGDGSGRQQLAKRADGSCVFLLDDGLCRIHKEWGFEAKPLICRMFPLQLVPHEKQAVLTLRRACPSAAADEGRELSNYLDVVRSYAAEGHLIQSGVGAPPFKAGEGADWKRSRIVLEALRRITADARYPIIRRLVHGLELCRLLEQANTSPLSNSKLVELVELLEQNIAEEAAPYFQNRSPPTSSARVLFRQTAMEIVRLHPSIHRRPTWSARWSLVVCAMRAAWGRGKLPRVGSAFPDATFAQLEEPLGRLEAGVYEPLTRYFETTTASYQYALAQKGGWSIVESYWKLALFYPVALWLLRWLSAGRTPTEADVLGVIAALDRSQGYAPLGGLKQRSRLKTLNALQEIPTLVVWYGR